MWVEIIKFPLPKGRPAISVIFNQKKEVALKKEGYKCTDRSKAKGNFAADSSSFFIKKN